MRASFLTVAVSIVLPTALSAQTSPTSLADERAAVIPAITAQSAGTPHNANVSEAGASDRASALRRVSRRRRGSMVGYIEDGSLTTHLRLRADAGFGNDTPDRAEFFYSKCGCYRDDPPPNFDADAPGPGPGVPTDMDFQQVYLEGEFAFSDRLSLFGEVSARGIQPQAFLPGYGEFPDQSGLGDSRVGAKLSLISSETRDLTLMLRVGLPTGDSRKGLGTNIVSVEPMLLFGDRPTDRLGFEAQLGAWYPTSGARGVPTEGSDEFSGNVLSYGLGFSYDVAASDRFRLSPVAEMVGWRVLDGFQTTCDELTCSFDVDRNIVNLKLGARATMANGSSVYLGYGFPLTTPHWYMHILRLEYRHTL